ncbi:hypothetical protein D3C71_707520 [compost metagenome]
MGRVHRHSVQEQGVQTADVLIHPRIAVCAEGDGVTRNEPGQRNHRKGGDRLGDGGDHVFAAHHAAIEERQTRQGHQQDQGGGGPQPGRARRIQLQRNLM